MNKKVKLLMNWDLSYLSVEKFECDKCFKNSLNHEIYLELVKKSTLFQFD